MKVTEEALSHTADVGGARCPTQQEQGTTHPFGAVAPKANDPLEPQDGIRQEALKQANSP